MGGGILNHDSLTIIASTFYSNTALDDGGGIHSDAGEPGGDSPTSTVTIRNSTIRHNGAGRFGGGILNQGSMTIVDTTIFSNTTDINGGGIMNDAQARGLTITRSNVSDNRATQSMGGGIHSIAPMTITNSTVSDNRSFGNGGGINVAACVTCATNLTHLTISRNWTEIGNGGGINRQVGAQLGVVTVKNTIVAGNMRIAGGTANDCGGTNINTEGDNLVGQNGAANGCPVDAEVTVVAGAISTVLDPLADNGGATETHALVAGSPAIDGVTDCTDLAGSPVTTDQRGMARPQGPACDIGAYEAAPALSIAKTVTPQTDVPYNGVVTYTIVLGNDGLVPGTGVELSDTLPGEIDFASWVAQPAGATVVNDVIAWSGTVPTDTTVAFSFVATHTGDYGDVVTNTAEYDHSSGSGSDDAVFTVESGFSVYLPILLKNR
jgi:uncharacterized repeat protein (TIGR01451 family)